jgi:hypothetical protein
MTASRPDHSHLAEPFRDLKRTFLLSDANGRSVLSLACARVPPFSVPGTKLAGKAAEISPEVAAYAVFTVV